MILVLSATNRPGSNTLRVAKLMKHHLAHQHSQKVELLDLQDLPAEIFQPTSYAEKPASFAPFQQAISHAKGILVVVPEYNGSFPGVAKYFIDMLKFPESLVNIPTAFVGVAAGQFGAMRSVEQLAIIFQYRSAHLYGNRVFIPGIAGHRFSEDGTRIENADLQGRLEKLAAGFSDFVQRQSAS